MAIVELETLADSTPGATSNATSSFTPTNGHGYLVFLLTITTGGGVDATLAGWGQTWTQVSTLVQSTQRRVQLFKCYAQGASTGALTFSYSVQPDIIDWAIVDLGPTGPNVLVDSNTAASGGSGGSTGVFQPITMNSPASALNVPIAFFAGNTSGGTYRLELAADNNGNADWVTVAAVATGATKARFLTWGYRNSWTDLTPGGKYTVASTTEVTVAEIDYANIVVGGMAGSAVAVGWRSAMGLR